MKAIVNTDRNSCGSKWTFTEVDVNDDDLFDHLTQDVRNSSPGQKITIEFEEEDEDKEK